MNTRKQAFTLCAFALHTPPGTPSPLARWHRVATVAPMAQHPFDLPIDPTPTWPTLRDRLSCAIESIEACAEGGEDLTGPERIAVARVLNAYATPLICALRSLTTRPPPAA